ncbi:MAG: hypothetical protein ACE5F9_10945 [Phycisphaerae bacterium]
MFRTRFWLPAVVLALAATGCVNVKAPDEISIGGGHRNSLDADKVPVTASHKQARRELIKAYEEIRALQSRVRKLEDDRSRYKHERDEYKHKYKQEKKRYDD